MTENSETLTIPCKGVGQAVFKDRLQRNNESWLACAARVAAGNTKKGRMSPEDKQMLEDFIARGVILTSGRHLQHGDETQDQRSQHVFTNCSTAPFASVKAYLLLCGSGVGRSYDDDMMVLDYRRIAPFKVYLSPKHADTPEYKAEVKRLKERYPGREAEIDAVIAKASDLKKSEVFAVPDTREGWAKAIEQLEVSPYKQKPVEVYDFTKVRERDKPIAGMQGKPASGPVPLMMAFVELALFVTTSNKEVWSIWKLAMVFDHLMAAAIVSGGVRRSARIAVKYWKDNDILDFIKIKSELGLYTANNSVGVDDEFERERNIPGTRAYEVAQAILHAQYDHLTGEPGIINLHKLTFGVEGRRGLSDLIRDKMQKGEGLIGSDEYDLCPELKSMEQYLMRAMLTKPYPFIVNPCAEIILMVLGGFCVLCTVNMSYCKDIAEFLKACELATMFAINVNLLDSIFKPVVQQTNRIGVSITGFHEGAYKLFGIHGRELLEGDIERLRNKEGTLWHTLKTASNLVRRTSVWYSELVGLPTPHTCTTGKPEGTMSKLVGVSEGFHFPSVGQLIRWVQCPAKGKEIKAYEKAGYPVKHLKSIKDTSVVGFPYRMEIVDLVGSENFTAAQDLTIAEHFDFLHRIERTWIDGDHNKGNQISYTIHFDPTKVSFEQYAKEYFDGQAKVKCCSVLPIVDFDTSAFEYLPEEPITAERYAELLAERKQDLEEHISEEHLQCAGGICPI